MQKKWYFYRVVVIGMMTSIGVHHTLEGAAVRKRKQNPEVVANRAKLSCAVAHSSVKEQRVVMPYASTEEGDVKGARETFGALIPPGPCYSTACGPRNNKGPAPIQSVTTLSNDSLGAQYVIRFKQQGKKPLSQPVLMTVTLPNAYHGEQVWLTYVDSRAPVYPSPKRWAPEVPRTQAEIDDEKVRERQQGRSTEVCNWLQQSILSPARRKQWLGALKNFMMPSSHERSKRT